MSLAFEWDAEKALANERKHGVSFDEAATAFGDPLSVTIPDPDHSDDEGRYILMGSTYLGRILVVVHTERGDNIRIVSARRATRTERRSYEG
jgi:uncharacterized DUF497 family protein